MKKNVNLFIKVALCMLFATSVIGCSKQSTSQEDSKEVQVTENLDIELDENQETGGK